MDPLGLFLAFVVEPDTGMDRLGLFLAFLVEPDTGMDPLGLFLALLVDSMILWLSFSPSPVVVLVSVCLEWLSIVQWQGVVWGFECRSFLPSLVVVLVSACLEWLSIVQWLRLCGFLNVSPFHQV